MFGPILKIGGVLEFELEQGFSDGYNNNIRPTNGLLYRTHPTKYVWRGGQFRPLQISINLVVGVQSKLQTPQDLTNALTTLYKLSLSQSYGQGSGPDPVTVEIGSWFRRDGYIENLDVTFNPPWDINTGESMNADVQFALVADFLSKTDVADSRYCPNASNFHFKYVGRSSGQTRRVLGEPYRPPNDYYGEVRRLAIQMGTEQVA